MVDKRAHSFSLGNQSKNAIPYFHTKHNGDTKKVDGMGVISYSQTKAICLCTISYKIDEVKTFYAARNEPDG